MHEKDEPVRRSDERRPDEPQRDERLALRASARPELSQILALQRSAGNRAVVARMKVTTQNKAQVEALKTRFTKVRGGPKGFSAWDKLVAEVKDLDELTRKVDEIAPARAARPVRDATANPFGEEERRGGMDDTDAQTLANFYGWERKTSSNWFCPSDKSHTPKGAVFYDATRDRYFGGDNSGHVGFCFKVWSGSKENNLTYLGCAPHSDPDRIIGRGAQRQGTKKQRRAAQGQQATAVEGDEGED